MNKDRYIRRIDEQNRMLRQKLSFMQRKWDKLHFVIKSLDGNLSRIQETASCIDKTNDRFQDFLTEFTKSLDKYEMANVEDYFAETRTDSNNIKYFCDQILGDLEELIERDYEVNK